MRRGGRRPAPAGRVVHREGDAGHGREDRHRPHREAAQDAARDGRVGEPRVGGGRAARLRVAGARDTRGPLRRANRTVCGEAVGHHPRGRRQPVHPARLRPVHLVLPLRPRMRRAAGRPRDQRHEPRLRHADHRGVRRTPQGLGLHVLRPVRADLPHRRPRRPQGAALRRGAGRDREDAHHLSLLRGGMLGGHPHQGRPDGRHPAGHGRTRQPGRAVREGAVRIRLRAASRPTQDAAGARGRRRAARDRLGNGTRPCRRRIQEGG